MSREINVRIDLRIAPLFLKGGLVGLLLAVSAIELGSESVTLTTYYPAPSGVYSQMITTQNTYLSRDGGYVAVGTTAVPSSAQTKMAVMNGNVGIGTVNPDARLHVPLGNVHVGDGNSALSGIPAGSARGYLYIDNTNTGCAATTISGANVPLCGGGEYAAWNPGLYINGWSYQNRGGQPVASWAPGATTSQVWGLNTTNGAASWMTLMANNSSVGVIYCCPK